MQDLFPNAHIAHTIKWGYTTIHSLHKNRPAISKKGSRVAYSQCMHDGKHNPYVFVVWWPEWANSFLAPGVNERWTVALVVVVALCMSIIVIASILTSYTYLKWPDFFLSGRLWIIKSIRVVNYWWLFGLLYVCLLALCTTTNFEPLKGRILTNWGNVPL